MLFVFIFLFHMLELVGMVNFSVRNRPGGDCEFVFTL